MTAGRVAYLVDSRPCGGCGHLTGDHWTEVTESFTCTRPGCDCPSWWSLDVTPEDPDGEFADVDTAGGAVESVLRRDGLSTAVNLDGLTARPATTRTDRAGGLS